MIAILDPGIGNLSSVRSGFLRAGATSVVIDSADAWHGALHDSHAEELTGVVLPGVGAFGDAMFQLRQSGLIPIVRQIAREGRPILGICLGMQLLFGHSYEHGRHVGLGMLPGDVVRFKGSGIKVPHMGWNSLDVVKTNHPLLDDIAVGEYVYFVHSYHAVVESDDDLLAAATYGDISVPAVVGRGSILGTQFHPEKSGSAGEQILHNFVTLCDVWRQKGAIS